ncbi:MAG: hypothetical protein V8T62_00595 [Oscillospiraceae bacterium]
MSDRKQNKDKGNDHDEPVLFAVLSDENDLAVITNPQRFLGQIIVYDHSLEDPVFSWK